MDSSHNNSHNNSHGFLTVRQFDEKFIESTQNNNYNSSSSSERITLITKNPTPQAVSIMNRVQALADFEYSKNRNSRFYNNC